MLMLSSTDDPPLKAEAQQLSACAKYSCLVSNLQALSKDGKDTPGLFHLPLAVTFGQETGLITQHA